MGRLLNSTVVQISFLVILWRWLGLSKRKFHFFKMGRFKMINHRDLLLSDRKGSQFPKTAIEVRVQAKKRTKNKTKTFRWPKLKSWMSTQLIQIYRTRLVFRVTRGHLPRSVLNPVGFNTKTLTRLTQRNRCRCCSATTKTKTSRWTSSSSLAAQVLHTISNDLITIFTL